MKLYESLKTYVCIINQYKYKILNIYSLNGVEFLISGLHCYLNYKIMSFYFLR